MPKKYYLKNIKVENKAIIGDCPICGHQHIGFNYGGNAFSHPIGCGWAGSFTMSCPQCGSEFGHGGHEMPSDPEKALYMLEPNDVLEARIQKVKKCQEYLKGFDKEEDKRYSYSFDKYKKETIKEIDNCLNTYNDRFNYKDELLHFYYGESRWHSKRSSFCVFNAIEQLCIDKIESETQFLEAISNNKELIREISINNIENKRQDIFYWTKTIDNYKLLYQEKNNEIKVFNTLSYESINLSFLINQSEPYLDKYATGLEGVVGITNIQHLQFVESIIRDSLEISSKKRCLFDAVPNIQTIKKAKDILEYQIAKHKIANLEKEYSQEELDSVIPYNIESLNTLNDLIMNNLK